MSDVAKLQQRLAELRDEHATITNTRTKEDVRSLAESWLAAACARTSGATGFVLNQHIGPEQVAAVLSEYLLEAPALLDFIVAKVEATTELTNRARDSRARKLNQQIEAATAELREARKKAAMEQLEREFAA
jgi:hypothetical protein